MDLEDLLENIHQRKTSRSKISRSKGMIWLKMLKYIALDLIVILLFLKTVLPTHTSMCSPKSISSSLWNTKLVFPSLPCS